MKRILTFACLATLATTNLPGQYIQATKQARRVVNQVGERQAETQATPTAPTAPPPQAMPPPPPNPALVALQLNISNLATDLAGLQTNPIKKQPLINDLSVAVQGASPAQTSVAKLTDDLAAGLTGKSLSVEQRTKLAQYLRAIFNSSHVSPAQQRAIFEDAPKILQAGGVSADNAAKVVADLKAVAAETK